MLYPESIESKLGFDTIRAFLIELCQSKGGEGLVRRMGFSDSLAELNMLLNQTREMVDLIGLGFNINLPPLDVHSSLADIRIDESFLEGNDLLQVADVLQATIKISDCIASEDCKHLNDLSKFIQFDRKLPIKILGKFDKNGILKDSASPELSRIRKNREKENKGIRRTLNQIFKIAQNAGIIPDNSQPTFRDGRFVIPIIASHKRQIKGFIHDESATGQTVYLEPSEVLETNNKIVELNHEEKRETTRIYKALTLMIRDQWVEVNDAFQYLSIIDFVHAKAKLGIALEATLPKIENFPSISLLEARHPILYINHKKEGKQIVPLTIEITKKNHVILISGPNAGGKSVCLKTVGLIQYMLQCGLLVPCQPDSSMGLFTHVFVDMGDEQSIENDLSTYSSHLKNMNYILKKADNESLVLIDEFGTGTDPEFGGAIAEAILGKLINKGAFGIITTHYGNLKEFAQSHTGIMNAAMQFDLKKLEPLYKLEMDKPGSSFALEVAHKIGLPEDVLKHAKDIVGADSIEVENLINKLSNEKRLLEEKLEKIRLKEEELNRLYQKYQSLNEKLEDQTGEIIQKAKIEAEQLLEKTNQRIEKTIRHIKENKAHKQETKKIRRGLESFRSSIKSKKVRVQAAKEEGVTFLPGEIHVGDNVLNEESGISGEVLDIKGNNVRVIIGDLKTQMKLKKLKKIQRPVTVMKNRNMYGIDISGKQSSFSTQLDLRGKRSNEVTGILDQYIDDALLLGHRELKILHGKGDGILRTLVRNHLKTYEQVVLMKDEHVERGGAGITVVSLK